MMLFERCSGGGEGGSCDGGGIIIASFGGLSVKSTSSKDPGGRDCRKSVDLFLRCISGGGESDGDFVSAIRSSLSFSSGGRL